MEEMQKPLFKYLPKKYLEAFLDRGSLKIGTLYEYRKTETYGNVIGDNNEGLHKTELFLPGGGEIDLASDTPEAEYFRQHVLRPDQRDAKVKLILEDGARFIAHSNSEDLYIYCLTSEYSPAVMREFGCDACLEIFRPQEFFEVISRKIRHKAKFNGLGRIQYINKTTHYKQPHMIHPAAMKDLEYEYQKEWRAIWIPNKFQCQPLFINVPKAIRHCRPFEA
jgi:hypothetical protein